MKILLRSFRKHLTKAERTNQKEKDEEVRALLEKGATVTYYDED